MVAITSWGRIGSWEHDVRFLTDRNQVVDQLQTGQAGLAYGMGRSYGDVCLNPGGVLWNTTRLDRYINFDESTGLLVCEPGLLLRDIQRLAIPRGWILPVSPGTQLVTVGGAIANDVHSKNHHMMGSFGDHVLRLKIVRTNGEIIDCGPESRAEWFAATVGGLGLTGIIVEAEIQLRRAANPWLDTEIIAFDNLTEFFRLADNSETEWEHTVSWIDCLSGSSARGLFMRGNFTDAANYVEPKRHNLTIPFVPPFSLVNRLSLRLFNRAYFHLQKKRSGRTITYYEPFFYPLDNILEWNRIYGPHGFYQYQCVVPRPVGQEAVQAMLKKIAYYGDGSFLTVLKTFGDRQALGMMSFPQPGVTLALDFPNKGRRTLKLLEYLDAVVGEAGGRIYLAKDARMSRDLFQMSYPHVHEFLKYRDPGISSGLSRRLMGI